MVTNNTQVVLLLGVMILFSIILFMVVLTINQIKQDDTTPNSYKEACQQLRSLTIHLGSEYNRSLKISECVQYLNENSNSTGQDVFDHFEIKKQDQFLTETIIISNND